MKSRRKTFRLKRTAKKQARQRGRSVYKVKGGWRVATCPQGRRRKHRKSHKKKPPAGYLF